VHTPLACAHHRYLYKEDLEGIIPANGSAKDRTALVEQFVKTWIINQLLVDQAEKKVVGAQREEIEKKVADYRSTLLTHVYLDKLVNEKVKQDITDQEIQDYYQAYQENFKLKHSILKGKLVVVPKNAPQVARLKQLIPQDSGEALKELKEYCATHATYASLDNKVWFKWDDIVPQTLSSNILYHALDQTKLSKKPYLKEMQDASYRYYLQIDAYKSINDIAPMELVKDQIAKVILYKRKMQLANQIREDILQQAKANNDYTIYENKN
jgi:hypothetical protein